MNSRRMTIKGIVQQLCKEEEVGFVGLLCSERGHVYGNIMVSTLVETGPPFLLMD